MDAIILEKPGQLQRIQKDEVVASLSPGEALIHIRLVGVCGTDFHELPMAQRRFVWHTEL